MTLILQTLRGGGNALVCVDTAGRVLELAHMVDSLWQNKDSGLMTYSLALLNNVSYNVVEFAKSQIEWMSEKLMRNFEGKRNNPFTFRHLKLCHSIAEVNKVPSPKVVLASTSDMECGFSRELFAQWCVNGKNSVILTSRSAEGTLAHDLISKGGNRSINVVLGKRIKLSGQELEDFKKKEKKKNEELMNIEDESSSDEEMMEQKPNKAVKHDIIMRSTAENEGQRNKFFKSTKYKFPMYPHQEEKIRWDDYGEIIKPEDWVDHSIASTQPITDQEDIDDSPAAGDMSEVPTKCVQQNVTLNIKAQIQFIDFEGRSDGESMMKLIMQVKPRRVIVVRGSMSGCETMAKVAHSVTNEVGVGNNKKVFLPATGEMVDATTESYIYQVRLPDSLMSRLSFQHAKDNAYLAWVDGALTFEQNELMDIETEQESKTNVLPTLSQLAEEQQQGHATHFVNELKLSDFKMVLSRHNINSEFQGGVLFCGSGNVALRRHDSGRVTIEGCVSDEYYLVRELLYEQYAIV